MKNKLKCVLKKFCIEKYGISTTNDCQLEIQANLDDFKIYIRDKFIEIILGNISLGRDNYMRRRSIGTVLDSLLIDIEVTVDGMIYTEIKKASGLISAPKSAPVTWMGDLGFDQFREDFVNGIKVLFPTIIKSETEIVPNSVFNSKTIEDVYKKVKVVPYEEIKNLITQFCNGRIP